VDMPNLAQAISAACCGAQTRGVAYANNKLFFNSLDGQLFGLDAETGEVLWRNEVANLDIAETTTTAPLIMHNHLVIGVAGGERGVRGWVAAFDQDTGEQLWKMYSTGPDDEMGIGPRFKPFYVDDQVENPGLTTWYGDSWRLGGGTVWGWWSYDPDADIFYYSTGNCAPWNPDYRRDPATAPGIFEYSNKYCAALMARDGTTGELLWAYSLTPQDQWDLDEPGPNLLLDLEINGAMRKTLVKAARNGFFYVFDRLTGEILNDPWLHSPATWTTGEFDKATGRPVFDPERYMYTDVIVKGICPFIGARNWENDTYSPQTGLMYFTIQNRCADMEMVSGEYVPGQSYTLYRSHGSYLGPDGTGDWRAELVAVNPVTGEKAWGQVYRGTMGSWAKPVMTTGGGLLFQGSETGEFRAFDAATGDMLWQFRTGTDFRNAPMTYIGPDGKQYVAVIASSAPTNQALAADAPADDARRFRRASATLYVFGMP
jgi:lanthanide-dependent methanol dehydrogenase